MYNEEDNKLVENRGASMFEVVEFESNLKTTTKKNNQDLAVSP